MHRLLTLFSISDIFIFLITNCALGIVTFALSNIDDLLLLCIYFAHPQIPKKNVVAGQYAGVLTLVLISLIGSLLDNFIPSEWIGFLGFLPIILGIKHLIRNFQGQEETTAVKAPVNMSLTEIALVTIANGGDNIGVYLPLFAASSYYKIILFLFTFAGMIAVWCLLAAYAVRHPSVKNIFQVFGHRLLPYFLIALGIYIFYEAHTFALFFP